MAIPRSPLVLVMATTVAMVLTDAVAVPAAPQGVAAVLDRYAGGDFVGAVADMTSPAGVRNAGRWPRELRDWIEKGDRTDRRRRTHVASAFALEVVARGVEGTRPEYEVISPILEAACEAVRRLESEDDELLFHLAAVALLQGAHDQDALLGPPRRTGDLRLSHIRHAAARTPHSRLLLAWTTELNAFQVLSSWPQFHGKLNRYASWDPGTSADTRELRESLGHMSRLADDPIVGSEARLRRGVLTFLMREPGEGLEDFTHAASAADSSVSYLAHMMLGILHEKQERLDDAIVEYRKALAIAPAPSAVTRLSYALFMNGEAVEAGERAASLRSAERFADPWHLYSLRDYRFWPAYRERLRAWVK